MGLLRKIGVFGTLIAAGGLVGLLGKYQENERINSIRFSDVVAGRARPEEYIEKIKRLPLVKKAKEEGVLKEIYYNPSDNKVKDILVEYWIASGRSKEDAAKLSEEGVAVYREGLKHIDATIATFPIHTETFGSAATLIVQPGFFNLGFLNNDADVRYALNHEIGVHARDIRYGMVFGKVKVDKNTNRDDIRNEFLVHVGETRALHYELSLMFEDKVRNGKYLASEPELASTMARYHEQRQLMQSKALTPNEKEIAINVTEATHSITTSGDKNVLRVTFDLFGKQETLTIGRVK